MLEVSLAENKDYSASSTKQPVTSGKKYSVSAKVAGISGETFCGFFGVILLSKNDHEPMGRRIQWLKDFSGQEKEYQIIFKVPEECGSVKIIYRINKQTPVKCDCKFMITPIDQIKLQEEKSDVSQNYEKLSSHTENTPIQELTEEEEILERNLVWIFYHPNKQMESVVELLFPKTIKSAEILNKPLIGSRLTNVRKMSHTYVRDIDFRATRRNYFFNYKYIRTWRFYFRKLVLNRIHAQFQDLKSPIVVNDSDGSTVADLLMECFPNSKILFLANDGRGELMLAPTATAAGLSKKSASQANKKRDAEFWRISTTATMHAYDLHPNDRKLLVKYEELLSDPIEACKRIYDFSNVKLSEEDAKDLAAKISKDAQNGGSNDYQLSEEDNRIVQDIMAEMLSKLGYTIKSTNIKSATSHAPIGQNQSDEEEVKKTRAQRYDGHNVDPISLVKLTPDQEDILEQNLVWILSNPRSGTTWLGTQLLTHGTRVWNEPLIGAHLVSLKETELSYARDIDLKAKRRNYIFSEMYSATWKHFVRKLILNRTYAQFQDLGPKIIIKEPNGTMSADIISQCLPNSKMIVLLRDGRDTVDSRLNALIKGGWGTRFFGENSREPISQEERPKVIRTRSKLWRIDMEIVLQAYEKHKAENRLMVRYEELRKNTFEETKKIYQFIGIPISDKKLKDIIDRYTFENLPDSDKGSGKRVRSASPGKWRDSFSEEEKKIMHDIMGDILEKLGYLKQEMK